MNWITKKISTLKRFNTSLKYKHIGDLKIMKKRLNEELTRRKEEIEKEMEDI